MPLTLEDQIAIVTGASGGIVRSVALEFARAGANVVVHTHRRVKEAEALAKDIRSIGREATVLEGGLADASACEDFAAAAWEWKSRVDVLVKGAGADVLTGDAANWSFEKKLGTLWEVDVLATIRLSRTLGARMKEQGAGVILNLGWDQAEHGMAGDSGEIFAAVKGAIMAFTRSLAQSLGPQVRGNCLAPGWIKTSLGERASDYWQERAQRQSLLGRWGTPEDVAKAAVFLASPAAEFINGQVIPVNGGFRYE